MYIFIFIIYIYIYINLTRQALCQTNYSDFGIFPGPDSGLWTLQSSFYAACYGPVPLEFLEKLGDFQAPSWVRKIHQFFGGLTGRAWPNNQRIYVK